MRYGWLSVFALGALSLSACFNTRILFSQSSKVQVSREWDETWYHDAVLGLAEISGPIKLDEVCPSEGAAYAEQKTSFLNGLVEKILYNVYNPQTVTVYCKENASQAPKVKHRVINH